jgi:hypothetical protein
VQAWLTFVVRSNLRDRLDHVAYREQKRVCAFCDDPAETTCRRCNSAVCALDRQPGAWCLMCQQELDDLQLETAFRSDVEAREPLITAHERSKPDEWLATDHKPGSSVLAAFASSFLVHIDSFFRRRAVRRRFLARSADEIAAWRAGAGIRSR